MHRWTLAMTVGATMALAVGYARSEPSVVAAAGHTPAAHAAAFYGETDALSVDEVVRLLGLPDGAQTPKTRTRAVKLLDEPGATGAPVRRDVALPDRFRPARPGAETSPSASKVGSAGALALPLRFNFNSTDVLASGTQHLDTIAAGIRRLPAGAIVMIEGHTDAHGSDALNNELSLRRALAVRSYLMRQHGLPGAMLVAAGRGKAAPLLPDNPFASANRRVEFRAEYELRDGQPVALGPPATPHSPVAMLANMVLGRTPPP